MEPNETHDLIAALAEFNLTINNPNANIYEEVIGAGDEMDLLATCLTAVSIEPNDLLNICEEKPHVYREMAGVMYAIAILMARRAEVLSEQ